MGKNRAMVLVGILLILAMSVPAFADGPAVSAPNAKLDILGGSFDGDWGYIAAGSGSLPIGKRFGFQLDAGIGSIGGDRYYGFGGHLFARDPQKWLVGIISSYQELENVSIARTGVEGELYFDLFSLRGRAGYQYGDVKKGGFYNLRSRWYPTDNILLYIEGEMAAGTALGKMGAEYQFGLKALPGLAIFAEGAVGEKSYDRYYAGLRYYFGSNKSLKLRHRQDDPDTLIPDGMNALQGKLRENRKAQPAATTPPPVEPPPCTEC